MGGLARQAGRLVNSFSDDHAFDFPQLLDLKQTPGNIEAVKSYLNYFVENNVFGSTKGQRQLFREINSPLIEMIKHNLALSSKLDSREELFKNYKKQEKINLEICPNKKLARGGVEVGKVLGEGAFGKVFQATYQNRQIAIK